MSAAAPSASLPAPRTEDQIRADITGQVNADISSAEAPLNTQITTLGSNRDAAIAAIDKMFTGIQPAVQQAADQTQAAYTTAEQTQQQIYSAANQRLNQLKQQRAQEAQAVAQEVGGPVSVGEFTQGVDPAASAYAVEGGGQMLHTLAYGEADVGAANAFAGRVFPLVHTEQDAQARQFYETQIKEIQGQINQIEASRTSAVNKGVSDAMIAERQYALSVAQQKLDETKQTQDYQASVRSLNQEQQRINLAKKQFAEQKVTDKRGFTIQQQNINLQLKQLTQSQKHFAANLGLSNREFAQKVVEAKQATTQAQAQLRASQQALAAQYLDAAVNPKPGKTITYSQAVPVTEKEVLLGTAKDAYQDKNSPTGYSRLVTIHQSSVTTPITNPNNLVDYLIGHNVSKPRAISMVRARLSLGSGWQYKPPSQRTQKPAAPPSKPPKPPPKR